MLGKSSVVDVWVKRVRNCGVGGGRPAKYSLDLSTGPVASCMSVGTTIDALEHIVVVTFVQSQVYGEVEG